MFKADQLGLLDKLVPVKGSVNSAGILTKPHMAHRKVRVPAPKAQQHDLFDEVNPRPASAERHAPGVSEKPPAKPKVAKKPAAEIGDLFAAPHAEMAPKEISPEANDSAPLATESAPKEISSAPEPPTAAIYRDGFHPDAVPEFGVPAGISKEERRRLNAEAAKIATWKDGAIPGAPRDITPEKRAILSQYSGNGGCGDSLNEFYTDPQVAAAMWFVLKNAGMPAGAVVLEPSCATGAFLEVAPAGVKVVGVEMDPTSAKIGEVLHPGHEIENASLERFATRDTRQFDAVVGNAPFGLRGSLIKDDKPELKTAEAYFLDTSIDKTKPGGIVAMIVPTGIMDNRSTRAVRERLLRKAEFLGACRMPNTAFEHSHTGVTTDIVYFRKRPEDVAGALMTVKQDVLKKLDVWDDEFLSGGYFTGRGAANVFGTMTEGWRSKAGMGDDITVEGSMRGVPEAIAGFALETPVGQAPTVADILQTLGDDAAAKSRAVTGSLRRPYDNAKPGDTKVIDGVEYVLQGRPPRWHRVDEFMQTPAVTDAQELSAVIDAVVNGMEPPEGLAERVKAYVEKHGVPGKNKDLMLAAGQDKLLYRLVGAVKPDGSLSDAVRNIKAAPLESTFDAAAQSLTLDIGAFTPEQVAARWHQGDAETALDHLYASPEYARDPATGLWTSMDNYLSGELWPKLDAVKAALAGGDVAAADRGKYEMQAARLDETIDPKSLEDVEIELNSAFLPLQVVAGFFNARKAETTANWTANVPDDYRIIFDKGVYHVTGGLYDSSLLDTYLNRSGVRKDDWATIQQWNKEFKDWLCASPYRDEVEDLYNRKFRGFRQREYSNRPFEIPGLSPEMVPNDYHWAGLRWALEAGKGIVAADVGLGKTPRGLMLAKLLKATGKAKRPLIIPPKAVLANWVAEAEKWFPGSRILVIGETYSRDKDGNLKGRADTKAERDQKLHDLTQNDYDFIFISQPSFNDLDLDPITKGKYLQDDFWVQRGDSLGNAGDKRTNKIREGYEQAMAQREFQKRTDAIYFNDLGIDAIIGDEFHAFKNLYAAKNRFGEQPKFLGGQGLSNRALDMNFKARWVRENAGGKNVYGLTATPTKNSPLEIYSMLSHIAPEAFEQIGIRNSEEFLDRFCEFKLENVLGTSGAIEEKLVTAGFKNLGELREIMGRYIDRKTAEDVGLKLPRGEQVQHLVDMSEEQKSVYATLREMAKESAGKKDATGDMHIFSIMDKMGKAAMDLELLDPGTYAGADSPKYDAAAKEIVVGAKEGGQVVFADSIAVHDKMVAKLVAAGIPRNRIAVINAQVAATSAKRQNIADAFNARKLDVVIGNTATMGEGINLQKATTDIHHMDLPWEPASIQQRNGRGLRQGNRMEAVRLHTYLAKGSFDGYRYQAIAAKKDWQDLLWKGGDRVENLARAGSVGRADMMIMLAADPDAAREAYATNKAKAQERFDADKHGEAAATFGKYQEMKVSFAALKRKDTPSAHRLRVKLDRLKTDLQADKYFKPKHALDSDKAVLVQPQSGHAFEAGAAFEMPNQPDAPVEGGGKFVVTSVNPRTKEVVARRYGTLAATPLRLDLEKLNHITPIQHDEAAEQAEISRQLEEAAKTKMTTVGSMKEMKELPHAVISAHYGPLQEQIKQGMRDYTFHHDYGRIGFVGKNGEAKHFESYEAKENLNDHDVMLPIPAHREKAIDAYVADERAKEFKHHTPDTGRRNRYASGTQRLVAKYPGKWDQHSNAWESVGPALFGDSFKKEAHAKFEKLAIEDARRAPDIGEAIKQAAKMAHVASYGGIVTWPKRALALIWAKAKKEAKLGSTLENLIPGSDQKGYGSSSWRKLDVPKELFSVSSGNGREGYNVASKPAGEGLIDLAIGSKHYDLAAAMIVSAPITAAAAAKRLMALPDKKIARQSLEHLIKRHPEIKDVSDQTMVTRPGERFPHHGTQSVAEFLKEGGSDERAAA